MINAVKARKNIRGGSIMHSKKDDERHNRMRLSDELRGGQSAM